MPKVSIGLPVYNGEKYIKKSIDSLINQKYEDFEIIISDNASEDNTGNICLEYAKKDTRVKYHKNSINMGYAWNYNRVFMLSQGEFFKWHAHDDEIAVDFLEKCLEVMERNPKTALVFPSINFIDENNMIITKSRNRYDIVGGNMIVRLKTLIDYELQGNDIFWSVYGMFRSNILKQTSLHGTYIGGDQVLLMEIILRGDLQYISEPLLFIRKHPDSSMERFKRPKERYKECNTQRNPLFVFPTWNMYFKHFSSIMKTNSTYCQKTKASKEIIRRLYGRDMRTLFGEVKVVVKDVLNMNC